MFHYHYLIFACMLTYFVRCFFFLFSIPCLFFFLSLQKSIPKNALAEIGIKC